MQKLANLRQIGIFCFILAIPASKSSVGSRGGRMCFPWFTFARTRVDICFSSTLLHKSTLSAVLLRIASCRTRVEVCRYPHFYTLFAVSRLSNPYLSASRQGRLLRSIAIGEEDQRMEISRGRKIFSRGRKNSARGRKKYGNAVFDNRRLQTKQASAADDGQPLVILQSVLSQMTQMQPEFAAFDAENDKNSHKHFIVLTHLL